MTREEELKQAIEDCYNRFCKQTKRSGGILITSSIREFAEFLLSDPEIMKQAGWVREEDWISVEDELPDFGVEVEVYGIPIQRTPKMNGNPPVVRYAMREDLSNTMLAKDADRYQDKNQFRFMEEVFYWKPKTQPPKQ